MPGTRITEFTAPAPTQFVRVSGGGSEPTANWVDAQGNAKRDRSDLEKTLHNRWSEVAIPLAAPFALAEALPPEVWKAISILLGVAK